MDITKISTGKAPPHDVNVVIEIPQGSAVKYEVDKESGAIVVDRFLFTPMAYPAAYGFIPNTLSEDGDPADALVLVPAQVVPGAVIRARPIGVLFMEDEFGQGREDHLRPARQDPSAVQGQYRTLDACPRSRSRRSSTFSPGTRIWSRANG